MQIALSRAESGKTTITAHLETLPDADARDARRSTVSSPRPPDPEQTRWKSALRGRAVNLL
ncbi:MAG TPA: hypothetical protein VFG85_10625 [Gaiellaceae bacterium]|jgi:hypothetical protein|nr:hypothetical protein [Gaiellaceae bacterium]